jgi:DNA helicase II / ATP-dependent DNA helicase PcrA
MLNTSDRKLKKLNPKQLQAVKYGKGPLLIIAGAGTGKTTVITERIKYLITKGIVKPQELLALTFTDKAAREMEERVDVVMPLGVTQIKITTFHAFGEQVLRQEGLGIGLDPGYRLMTTAESVLFFRKNLFSFDLSYFRPLGNPNKFIEAILQHFSRLKDEDIAPNQYVDWVKSQIPNPKSQINDEEKLIEIDKYKELADTYIKYEKLKTKEGLMDFSDLISNTLLLFRIRKNILREFQEQYKYILIDEYQDTNYAQNELAKLLAGNKKCMTVVCDDDQSIYRFRGAAISNIIQFRKHYPEAKIVVLTKNYRSTKKILDRSYGLIQFNNPDRLEAREKISKKLTSARKIKGKDIEFIYTSKVEDEAEEVIDRIKNQEFPLRQGYEGQAGIKGKRGKYSWKDFAILVRANNHAEPFIRALVREGIPYQFLGPGMLFRQKEVKELIAYLRVVNDFSDSVALYAVLSMEIFDFSVRDLSAIINFAKKMGLSLFESVETLVARENNDETHWSSKKNYKDYLPKISQSTLVKLLKIHGMILRHLKLSKIDTAGQILYYFLQDSGTLDMLTDFKNLKEEKIALNISKFFDKLKSFENSHEDTSVSAVCDFLDMAFELGESPLSAETDWSDNNAVNILTVHASKGLEFPVVFLVNLVSQRFPTTERKEKIPIPPELIKEILPIGDFHLQEERRLFYVGMTRARDRLYFSASNFYGEGKRERKISPFVFEALGEKKVTKLFKEIKSKTLAAVDSFKKQTETELPVERQKVEYLSYSQIDNFSVCPLQYKYRYIVKIPLPTNSAGSFGTSVHSALEKFYKRVKNKEKLTKDILINFLHESWIPVGYKSRNYEEKMKNRGEDMLGAFFDKYYDPELMPKSLEQVFKIKLAPTLKIGGKIDRMDETFDGKLEIIDYKTGKRPTDKEIEKNLQMTVYAMAATDKALYGKKPEDVILTFYFLEKGEKVQSVRTKKQLEETKIELIKKAEEISKSTFPPHLGPWCQVCDFKIVCPAWK